ncbi:putative Polycomb group protein ASXL2 isoform X2 [Patiria miniata]|uniref:Polycomb group protein ASXL2 n=1 Tax=Patiria miniata TaxID=46514 RepID=A0A913ZYJ2_PATMI|nr:putative Polycomb group protein ASXL2 isoform X2 [Patiria miniata]
MKDKHRRRKGRTWAEAAKTVLEKQPNTPMSCKEILRNIKEANLKDISGTVPSACLNAVLHGGCRGPDGTFYKVADMMGVYGLRSHLSDEARRMLEYKLDDSVDVSSTLDALEEPDAELVVNKQQSGTKKMPVCYLPEKAHHLIPALRRFTLYQIPTTSTSSSSSASSHRSPPRAVDSEDQFHHHHHHRAKGFKATSQMHSPTRIKFTLHHKHQRRKQQIVPRIILKPVKSPTGKEPNYAAEVIDLTPSPSDNERDSQAMQDDDVDTDTSKDDNSENNLRIAQNVNNAQHPAENTQKDQSTSSSDQQGQAGNPSSTSDSSGNVVDNQVESSRTMTRSSLGVRGDGNETPGVTSAKSEAPTASRVSLRISMRQALPLQTQTRSQTMSKLMANVPGFSGKPRNREKKFSVLSKLHPPKKMSLHVDLETPDSILANVNLKALINKHTFNSLPAHYQYKLLTLLPKVDRVQTNDNFIKMNGSALDNEFFARACSKWRERLSSGEFTPESQLRLRQEIEKDMIKLDPWKAKHFEPSWGQSLLATAPDIPESFASMGVIPPEERKSPAMHTRSSSQRKGAGGHSVSTVYRNTRSAASSSHHHHQKPGYEPLTRHHRSMSSRESRRLHRMTQKELKYCATVETRSTPKQDAVTKQPEFRSVIGDINIKPSSSSSLPPSSQSNFSCSSLLSSMAMESQRNQAAATSVASSTSSQMLQKSSAGKEVVSLKRPLESSDDSKEKRLCLDDSSVVVLDSRQVSRSQSVSTQSSATVLTAVSCANASRQQTSATTANPDIKPKVLPSVKSSVNVGKQGTRTLAQIKAQTQARAQAHGQTRTLAQIKAQTTAKLLARSAAQAEAQNQAKISGHTPTILNRSRSPQWNTVKTVIPVALSTSPANNPTQASLNQVPKHKLENHVVQVNASNQQVVQAIQPFIIKTQPGSGVSVVYVTQPNVVTLMPASATAIQRMNKSPGLAKPASVVQTTSSPRVVVEKIPQFTTSVLAVSSTSASQRPNSIKTLLNLKNASGESPNSASPHEEKSGNTNKTLPNGTSPGTPMHGPTKNENNSRASEVVILDNKTNTMRQQIVSASVSGTPVVSSESIKIVTNSNAQVDPFSCRSTPSLVLQPVDIANGRECADSLDASPGKCSCRLGAMVVCKGCGAFCHDDCVSPTSLCMACVVR